MDGSTLEWLAERILEELAHGGRPDAAALQFLLHHYAATASDRVEEPLGAALARELEDQSVRDGAIDCAGWLILFSEAAALSDDPRLQQAALALLPAVRCGWSNPAVDVAMRSIAAALLSANIADDPNFHAAAVDALEHVIGHAYRPGEGIAHEIGGPRFVRGSFADHVYSASALLSAYMLTRRLPYAMLADELTQSVLRRPAEPDRPFVVECEAVRVFCRLSALHRDDEYRRTAVIPIDADYADSARRTLAALATPAREMGSAAAPFGIALAEWLDLQ